MIRRGLPAATAERSRVGWQTRPPRPASRRQQHRVCCHRQRDRSTTDVVHCSPSVESTSGHFGDTEPAAAGFRDDHRRKSARSTSCRLRFDGELGDPRPLVDAAIEHGRGGGRRSRRWRRAGRLFGAEPERRHPRRRRTRPGAVGRVGIDRPVGERVDPPVESAFWTALCVTRRCRAYLRIDSPRPRRIGDADRSDGRRRLSSRRDGRDQSAARRHRGLERHSRLSKSDLRLDDDRHLPTAVKEP